MTGGSYSGVRTKLDGQELFTRGHQIINTTSDARSHGHGAAQHKARMKRVPVWAFDDEKIKQLIKFHFPKANSDPEQRKFASRMVRIIYLYYRTGSTAASVAEELKMSLKMVEKIISKLNRAMAQPLKSVGRPKNNGVGIQTTNGTTGDDCQDSLSL